MIPKIMKNQPKKISNNINTINKSSKILMISFIFLALLQFYTFFNGNNQINQQYILKYLI